MYTIAWNIKAFLLTDAILFNVPTVFRYIFIQTMTATYAESLFDIKPPTDTTINYVNIVIFLVHFQSITPHHSLSVSA